LIVTCPACQARYRVEVADLARPGGRTLRCTACGHLWRHPPEAETPAGPHAEGRPTADLAGPLPGPPLPAPDPGMAGEASGRNARVGSAVPPRRGRWFIVGMPILVLLVVAAALAALYLSH
jgi:predicted Zn finger-like uncharacterized protein